ncbi:MAG: Hpt domain-containing protein [Eubacteriales bacterium]|nr:Hpt domain-containing protein [Eubacteriales bacterium]MDD3881053.1 Hpt domain-containing protein [Eubacteriales bacterium]MDD4511878.1 Hpt domain-containing protein [Eubacteriales bacterium]
MEYNTLMGLLTGYGVDAEGIEDLFMGNNELYVICFSAFLSEPNHSALKAAMEKGSLDEAFFCAHALKGLSGNLGLTPYYEADCELTEALRAKRRPDAEREYVRVSAELEKLREIAEKAEQPS